MLPYASCQLPDKGSFAEELDRRRAPETAPATRTVPAATAASGCVVAVDATVRVILKTNPKGSTKKRRLVTRLPT
jgi:hypothetical protein